MSFTRKLGLLFDCSKILPTYSPSIPTDKSWTPPKKEMAKIIAGYPGMNSAGFKIFIIIRQVAMIIVISIIMIASIDIVLKGFVEKDVTASIANLSILKKGYFE